MLYEHVLEGSKGDKNLDENKEQINKLVGFFATEAKNADKHDYPELEELDNFKTSSLYNDPIGSSLLQGDEFSASLFLRMFAHEKFSSFKESMAKRFADKKDKGWTIRNDFQKNAVKVWQQITDFKRHGALEAIQKWILGVVVQVFTVIIILDFIAMIACLCLEEHLRAATVK